MTIIAIVWAYLQDRLAQASVQVLLMALGVAMIAALLLFGAQFEQKLVRNGEGIDVIIGAKGSALQLVLSSVHHSDIPTGNIDYDQARRLMEHRAITSAIPLALGDSYHGFRIVGTEPIFFEHFKMQLAQGYLWERPLEAVIGAQVAAELGLHIGDQFAGTHGLEADGHAHENQLYIIVGIAKPDGSVRDRLILTSLQSVWDIHARQAHEEHDHDEEHEHNHAHEAPREITAILASYKRRAEAMTFPRYVNQQTQMQAASPAFEMARLNTLIGAGSETLLWFATILSALALLSVIVGIYAVLRERHYDLALLRLLGVPRRKLSMLMITEGMSISIAGCLLGLIIGHGAIEALGRLTQKGQEIGLTGWRFPYESAFAVALILGVCFLACLLPAFTAYRTDIRTSLLRG
jgi:putative ABC transport system permease protein